MRKGNSVKPSECEACHSYPARVEVKNAWNIAAASPYVFAARCLGAKYFYI